MNMINVMKRLAELDSQNPNMVNESKMAELDDDLKTMSAAEFSVKYKKTKAEARAAMKPESVKESLADCGMMPMPGMSGMSASPANISITASSGPELSGMLKDIMSLAGIQKAGSMDMPLTREPQIEINTPNPEDGMRSMIDKMNDPEETEFSDEDDEDDEDERAAHEGMYDNSPDTDIEQPDSLNRHSYQGIGGQPGAAKGRGLTANPRAHTAEDIESQLFAEYSKFVTETVSGVDRTKRAKAGKVFEKVKNAAAKSDIKDSKALATKQKVKESLGSSAESNLPEDDEAGYVKYEQMKDKIASVLIKLYDQGMDDETIKQLGDRVAQHLGYDPEDSVFQDAWMTSFTDASLDGSLDQDPEDDYTDHSMHRGEMGRESVQHESNFNQIKRREMEVELGHEKNNYQVVIDGRNWKVFASERQANIVAGVLRAKGKDATVYVTGASPTTA